MDKTVSDVEVARLEGHSYKLRAEMRHHPEEPKKTENCADRTHQLLKHNPDMLGRIHFCQERIVERYIKWATSLV